MSSPEWEKWFKCVCSYLSFFGSRFVGNDIQLLCGNILDHPFVKTFTLFCIMYQASNSFDIAIKMTVGLLIAQYLLSMLSVCQNYVDKTQVKPELIKTKNVPWAVNTEVDSLGIPKRRLSKNRHVL